MKKEKKTVEYWVEWAGCLVVSVLILLCGYAVMIAGCKLGW